MRSPLPSGVVSSRSSVPEVRSRSVAMLVTRNITTNGKTPSMGGADPVEDAGLPSKIHAEQPEQHAGHDEHQRDGAGVVPELAQHAAGGGDGEPAARSCARRRRASPRLASMQARRNACSTSSAPVAARSVGGRVVGEDPALAHQQQPVAAVGLVHDVAGDEQRRPARRRGGGRGPRGRRAAPGRGRRSARRAPAARGRRAGRTARRDPRRAGRRRGRPTSWSACVGEVDVGDAPVDRRRERGAPSSAAEVARRSRARSGRRRRSAPG